jgi:hypothetical protein
VDVHGGRSKHTFEESFGQCFGYARLSMGLCPISTLIHVGKRYVCAFCNIRVRHTYNHQQYLLQQQNLLLLDVRSYIQLILKTEFYTKVTTNKNYLNLVSVSKLMNYV